MPPYEPNQCPICREPNKCGTAQGLSECWCFTAGPPSAEVLEKIPPEAFNLACVCRRCMGEDKDMTTPTSKD